VIAGQNRGHRSAPSAVDFEERTFLPLPPDAGHSPCGLSPDGRNSSRRGRERRESGLWDVAESGNWRTLEHQPDVESLSINNPGSAPTATRLGLSRAVFEFARQSRVVFALARRIGRQVFGNLSCDVYHPCSCLGARMAAGWQWVYRTDRAAVRGGLSTMPSAGSAPRAHSAAGFQLPRQCSAQPATAGRTSRSCGLVVRRLLIKLGWAGESAQLGVSSAPSCFGLCGAECFD